MTVIKKFIFLGFLICSFSALAAVESGDVLLKEACKASVESDDIVLQKPVMQDLFKDVKMKNLVKEYRSSWRKFCKNSNSRDFQNLKKVTESFYRQMLFEGDLSESHLDQFLPLFTYSGGGDVPGEAYSASMEKLKLLYTKFGSEDDKLFAQESLVLIGTLEDHEKPWRELRYASAVFEGCLKLKDYEWTKAFEAIQKLKKNLKTSEYKGEVARIEKELLDDLFPKRNLSICACNSKSEALNSYRSLESYFKKTPAYSDFVGKISLQIKSIEKEKIKIIDNSIKPCGGG